MAADHAKQLGPALHTAAEAATILRVKRSWLERQAADRKVPFTILGGSYRFTTAHLDEIVRLYEQLPSQHPTDPPRRSRPRRQSAAIHPSNGQSAPLRARPRSGPSRVA